MKGITSSGYRAKQTHQGMGARRSSLRRRGPSQSLKPFHSVKQTKRRSLVALKGARFSQPLSHPLRWNKDQHL